MAPTFERWQQTSKWSLYVWGMVHTARSKQNPFNKENLLKKEGQKRDKTKLYLDADNTNKIK